MPDDQQFQLVGVRSNVDQLSAESVHRLFKDMIGEVTEQGEDFLRATVPRGNTDKLMRAVSSDGPHDLGEGIESSVGIPQITDAEDRMTKTPSPDFFSPSPFGYTSKDYPLFVDRGTGVFGPAHVPIYSHTGGPMKFEGREGETIFARSVQGQPPSLFMLATFEEMHRVSLPADAEIFRERVKHLAVSPPK